MEIENYYMPGVLAHLRCAYQSGYEAAEEGRLGMNADDKEEIASHHPSHTWGDLSDEDMDAIRIAWRKGQRDQKEEETNG